jgi:hypothetical protein
MIGHTVIFLSIEQELLPVIPFLNAFYQVMRFIVPDVCSVNGKEILLMTDVLGIDGIKITFAKRKIMDRIEKVGFPYPVISNETVDFIGKGKFRFGIIFKIC